MVIFVSVFGLYISFIFLPHQQKMEYGIVIYNPREATKEGVSVWDWEPAIVLSGLFFDFPFEVGKLEYRRVELELRAR